MLISDAANLTNEVATEHVAVDVKTEARRLIGEGHSVVPIPKGEKGPRIKGWQNLAITADEVDAYFNATDQNIGVLLGKPSGWLVDVDLDCPEAVRLSKKYLPPTGMITGREGRPGSHWWYICEGCETKHYKDFKVTDGKATTVELRSTRLQTVVGPSVFVAKDEDDNPLPPSKYDVLTGEPACVSAEQLAAFVKALHQAVLKERGHEDQGKASDAKPKPVSGQRSPVDVGGRLRPGDDYNQQATQASMVSYLESKGL